MQSLVKRQDIQIGHIDTFDAFRKSWKGTNFIKQMSVQQVKNKISDHLKQLLKDESKLCYMFQSNLELQKVQAIQNIIKSNTDFKFKLDFQYQPLFYGNDKQLLVFKTTNKSLISYVYRYRPDTMYKNLYQKLSQISKQFIKMYSKRNILISQRLPPISQQYIQLNRQIQKFTKQQYEPKLLKYKQHIRKLIKHFKETPKRQQFIFMGVNSVIEKQLKKIILQEDLYFSYRFLKISQYDENKDIVASKTDRNQSNQFDDQGMSSDNQDGQFIALEKQKQKYKDKQNNIRNHVRNLSSKQILPPKQIDTVRLLEFKPNGALYEIVLLPFGRKNLTEYLEIRLLYPKVQYLKKVIVQYKQKSNIELTKIQVLLEPLVDGPCVYSIMAKNQVGNSKAELIRFWVDLDQQTKNFQQKKIKFHINRPLYYMGNNNQNGILALQDQPSQDKKQITITTNQKWKLANFRCIDFSLSSYAMILNSQGDVAGWGKMYAQQNQGNYDQQDDQEQEQNRLDLGYIQNYTFSIEPLSLVLESKNIRKISCGEMYCLMTDYFGNAWSFGLNNYGQLGQQNDDNQDNRSVPTIIPRFYQQKIFITDVVASSFATSFAISAEGKAYRWGCNQVETSQKTILDNNGNVINYHYGNILISQPIPCQLTSKHISQPIKSIYPGNGFTLAITKQDNLYGWGSTKHILAYKNQMFEDDGKYAKVVNLCNPIPLQKNISQISVYNNKIVIQKKQQKSLWGWGDLSSWFPSQKNIFSQKPKLILQDFDGKFICGPNFNLLCSKKQPNIVKIIGGQKTFKQKEYKLPCTARKIGISDGVIMVMGQ